MVVVKSIPFIRFQPLAALAALLLLPAVVAGVGCAGGEEPERWNLVLVTVDSLRADHLGCYGDQRARTPNIDGFAEGALRYEHAFTAINTTLASHATMLTGRYPHEHGVPRNGFPLAADIPTLAELLHDRGYATAAVVSADTLVASMGLDRGFEVYDEAGPDTEERRAESATATALGWLEGRGGEAPFFLWVHYADPRYPYQPPPPFDTIRGDGYQGPADGSVAYRESLNAADREPVVEEQQRMVDLYDGEIAYLDHCLEKLFEALDRPGLCRRTLVAFTAGHGEQLTEGDELFGHGRSLGQASVRVPLVIRYPEPLFVPPGTVVRTVQTLDIFPTLLAAAGAEPPPGSGGTVLIPPPGCQEPAVGPEGYRPTFAEASLPVEVERPEGGEWPNLGKAAMAVRYPWKLVLTPYLDRVELYDLERDPLERENLASQNPGTVAELRLALSAWRADAGK